MKISLNWLKQYIDSPALETDLAGSLEKLTLRGLEVESIEHLAKGFDNVVVGLIKSREKHPNADRLSVCMLDDGKEIRQIVCGAQNMKAGDKVCMSLPGAHLPNGMKIEKGKIRDVESGGMLCSEVELGLATESAGIMILPADAPIGAPVAQVLGRNDVVFELNVTPNRGDALSHIGVARELASALGVKLKMPEAKLVESGSAPKFKVTIEAKDKCFQYHGRLIEGVKIGPSPEWLQTRLRAVGLRPINNVVDVTNFILLEYGTPLHAFDLKQVKGGEIRVRMAKAGEKLPLLDKTEVTLTAEDLVIADAERAIALAGVMGGGNSEVTDSTTDLLLETAQFLPTSVRRTAKRHQKHTDSSHRFEREIDALAVAKASDRAAALIAEVSGGKVGKGVVSAFGSDWDRVKTPRLVKVTATGLSKFAGMSVSAGDAAAALESIGFGAKASGDEIAVTVPTFRPDVTITEDVYEEVLRVRGYDLIPEKVPRMEFIPETLNAVDQRAQRLDMIRAAFVGQGFHETMNYAFTSKAKHETWGGPEQAKAVPLANPLNEEFTTLKTSLLGDLFTNLMTALNNQTKDVRLFELRPVYRRDEKSEHTGVHEEWMVASLLSGRAYVSSLAAQDREVDFFDMKAALENIFEDAGIRGVRFEAVGSDFNDPRFHPGQTAKISIGRGPCGLIGRLHPKFETENKIRQAVYVFEFSLDRALETVKGERKVQPISKFPKVQRDLSLLVPATVASEKVLQIIGKHGKPLMETAQVIDLFTSEKVGAGLSSLTVTLQFGAQDKTLADADVDAAVQKVLSGLDKDLAIKLRT